MAWNAEQRAKRWPPMTVQERIMAKVAKDEATGCWNFTGSTNGSFGYGCIWINGRRKNAHRAMYMAVHAVELQRWEFVCHRCDNPKCVNPAHLWLGTNYQNARDMMDKGRHPNQRKRFCKRGHPLAFDNLWVSAKGGRHCRICTRERHRRRHQANPAYFALRAREYRARRKAERLQIPQPVGRT